MRRCSDDTLIRWSTKHGMQAAAIEKGIIALDRFTVFSKLNAVRQLHAEVSRRLESYMMMYPDWAVPGRYASDETGSNVRPLIKAESHARYLVTVLEELAAKAA